MTSEAPSWADQWGSGGIGAMEEEDNTKTNKEEGDKKKAATSAGIGKAKAVAMAGAHKVKSGTSMGINWIKKQCNKKKSPANE